MDRLQAARDVLAKLAARNGDVWQEANGELQDTFGEFAMFILLYEDSDPRESHAAFVEIVSPYMEALAPTQFTVGYTILTETASIHVESFMDNEEILSALDDPGFGKHLMSSSRGNRTPFSSAVSTKRPLPATR